MGVKVTLIFLTAKFFYMLYNIKTANRVATSIAFRIVFADFIECLYAYRQFFLVSFP
jgi:hypothetical protein